MPTPEPAGRRERRKARTRAHIAETALELFLARGFAEVTTAEVAEAADVSVTTLFNHFPSKEALVVDEDAEREAALVAAVHDREPGTSVVDALHAYFTAVREARGGDDGGARFREFRRMILESPSLREHVDRMWARHEDSLAAAIAADAGAAADDPAVRALAHLVLAARSVPGDGGAGSDAAFALLRAGWSALDPLAPAGPPG
ncbi:helix-turn-helix domain-containing protein [Saccharopolyspora sp. NPDC047091]|uniref:TetR/AcrR family transcriptional regulator n=1 Tax=Saccharopolyspora sp. NPDC047091 TaxID=3155924 RepID=UPI00340ACE9C